MTIPTDTVRTVRSTGTVTVRLPDGTEVPDVAVEVSARRESITTEGGRYRCAGTVTDDHGHAHVFTDRTSVIPATVRAVEVPCNGACDDPGHTDTVLRCRKCKSTIEWPTAYRGPRTEWLDTGSVDVVLTITDRNPGALALLAAVGAASIDGSRVSLSPIAEPTSVVLTDGRIGREAIIHGLGDSQTGRDGSSWTLTGYMVLNPPIEVTP